MKNLKKILISCLCAAALVTVSVLGTAAYLTDRKSVANTFTVGNVEIKVDEAKTENGVAADLDNRTEEGNQYHLVPGETYDKDPRMTVDANSEDCYVRMLVTVNCLDIWDAIIDRQSDFELEDVFQGYNNGFWDYYDEVRSADGKTITYEFRYEEIVEPGEDYGEYSPGVVPSTLVKDPEGNVILPPLFTEIKAPGFLTNQDLKDLHGDGTDPVGKFAITIEGHAIQAATFEDDPAGTANPKTAVEKAWAAFDAQYKSDNTTQNP